MSGDILDDFQDLAGWTAIASGQARLQISRAPGRQGGAMRLDFDFQGGGGFVVARKRFDLTLPESYVVSFDIRGRGPGNILEFKLVDASNQNVWRWREEVFEPPEAWRTLRIKSTQIPFAWGPLGGGPAHDIAAIELVIAAGPGGEGTVSVCDLRLEDTGYYLTPLVEATSALPGYEPLNVCDPSPGTCWRSVDGDAPQRLLIDFQREREYGGLVIRWDPDRRPRRFDIQLSSDGDQWRTCYSADQGVGEETSVYLPEVRSRFVRLDLRRPQGHRGFGIVQVEVQPYEFSRSINGFFAAIAQRAETGLFPKYLLGRQTYWTPVGTGEDVTQALFNEEGMVEVDKGSFSIEPFLWSEGRLITWADASLTQTLERGYLPVPSSDWQSGGLGLRTTAFATGSRGDSTLFIRYRLANGSGQARRLSLFAAIRPFQVTPTWQHWHDFGGVSRIGELAYENGSVRVGAGKRIIPLARPSGFGAATFAQGAITECLKRGELPEHAQARDGFGYASGALRFDLELSTGATHDVYLAIPFGDSDRQADRHGADAGRADARRAIRHSAPEKQPQRFREPAEPPSEFRPREEYEARGAVVAEPPSELRPAQAFDCALTYWEDKLGVPDIRLPPRAADVIETLKTAAAHILINRDGPALQPGPRRYARSWIRDGVLMAAALARMGLSEAGRDFVRWYAGFQTSDGNLPDCVDRDGSEWLPEHDSWGELIFAVMDHYRFGGDRSFLAEQWPAVLRSVDYLDSLRRRRLTAEYEAPDKRARYGLLPESMSHEGYMAHPVHAYWDDFWALRGFKDAAEMAQILGEADQARRIAALRDAFQRDLYASLDLVIREQGLDFVPGSVEFADFDPAATAIALTVADELYRLPRPAIDQTFEKYLDGFRARARGDTPWANYSAYEIRIIGALVRMGRRREAHELLDFFLADRRIRPWNQWPEISWRDPQGPSFIGDMPHGWIGAEYILAVRSLFAYERESDRSLVIAAGIREDWLTEGGEVEVRQLPTFHGPLSYRVRREEPDTYRLTLAGDLALPPGGLVIMPPLPRPLLEVQVNGRYSTAFGPDSAQCRDCPAEVRMRF
ncbi:MAG: discoidin domain-containing protein [Chromatiaceae bacterium]